MKQASLIRLEHASSTIATVGRGRIAMLLSLLSLLVPHDALAERFDIVSFNAPPGWSRTEQKDGLVFESRQADGGSFCVMTVSRGALATASPAEELDRAWSTVLGDAAFAGSPETFPPFDIGNGVTVVRRMALVQKEQGALITMLNLLRTGDRHVMVMAIMSDRQAWERCSEALGDFVTSMKLDKIMPLTQVDDPILPRAANTPTEGRPDPQLAARFNNSVVGEWKYLNVMVNWSGVVPQKIREETTIRFKSNGSYSITYQGASESGSYRVDGKRILMQPMYGATKPYTLEWFFGTHPDTGAKPGLLLKGSQYWPGGTTGFWTAYMPPE